ncbi:putative vps53-like protein [Rosa chinensis]|uniref:Putative vps53-like protein n=1 Tax=Rosa chinensis TaxID=74649 RepID=A0A2P6SJN9_ROSCH|nr:putative vps53-like protein [Rosa chinensis]
MVLCDILRSGGIPGWDNGHQPPVYFAADDLEYKAAFPSQRLGMGAFRIALESIFNSLLCQGFHNCSTHRALGHCLHQSVESRLLWLSLGNTDLLSHLNKHIVEYLVCTMLSYDFLILLWSISSSIWYASLISIIWLWILELANLVHYPGVLFLVCAFCQTAAMHEFLYMDSLDLQILQLSFGAKVMKTNCGNEIEEFGRGENITQSASDIQKKYEKKLAAHQGNATEEKDKELLPYGDGFNFHGIISSCFVPHLTVYTELEEKTLMENLEKLVQEETWDVEEGSQNNVLLSSMQIEVSNNVVYNFSPLFFLFFFSLFLCVSFSINHECYQLSYLNVPCTNYKPVHRFSHYVNNQIFGCELLMNLHGNGFLAPLGKPCLTIIVSYPQAPCA